MHLLGRGVVEVAGRLVGQEQAGAAQQGPAERHPLHLAAGEPGHRVALAPRPARPGRGGRGRAPRRPPADRPPPAPAPARSPAPRGGRAGGRTGRPRRRGRAAASVRSRSGRAASGRPRSRTSPPSGSSMPAARWSRVDLPRAAPADDRHRLARPDLGADPAQHLARRAAGRPEGPRHVAEGEDRLHHRGVMTRKGARGKAPGAGRGGPARGHPRGGERGGEEAVGASLAEDPPVQGHQHPHREAHGLVAEDVERGAARRRLELLRRLVTLRRRHLEGRRAAAEHRQPAQPQQLSHEVPLGTASEGASLPHQRTQGPCRASTAHQAGRPAAQPGRRARLSQAVLPPTHLREAQTRPGRSPWLDALGRSPPSCCSSPPWPSLAEVSPSSRARTTCRRAGAARSGDGSGPSRPSCAPRRRGPAPRHGGRRSGRRPVVELLAVQRLGRQRHEPDRPGGARGLADAQLHPRLLRQPRQHHEARGWRAPTVRLRQPALGDLLLRGHHLRGPGRLRHPRGTSRSSSTSWTPSIRGRATSSSPR